MTGAVLVLTLLVVGLGDWQKPKETGGWIFLSVVLCLFAVWVPRAAAIRITGGVLSCIVLPSLAFLLALAIDRAMARDHNCWYFGDDRGRGVFILPVLLWLAFWIGGWHGEWAIGFSSAVVTMTAGFRLARPDADVDVRGSLLLGGIALGTALAWAFGPVLWPLPFAGWYWGTLLGLLLLPSAAVRVVERLWYRNHPLHHWDRGFREAAVGTLSSQEMLARVVAEDREEGIRQIALDRITDETLLVEVAKRGEGPQAERAVGRITDPIALIEIAERASNPAARKAAVRLVRDQSALARIVRHEHTTYIRVDALRRIADRQLLADLAKHDAEVAVRRAALERVEDQQVLAHVAEHDGNPSIRLKLVGRVSEPPVLARIALTDTSMSVRRAAVERVVDDVVLERVAKGDGDESIRAEVGERWLKLLASRHAAPEASVRRDAAEKLWRGLADMPRAKVAPFPLLAQFSLADLPDALFAALESGPREKRKTALKTLVALQADRAAVERRMGTVGPRARRALDEMTGETPKIPRTLDMRTPRRHTDSWNWGL
jgi:hypothetical protein